MRRGWEERRSAEASVKNTKRRPIRRNTTRGADLPQSVYTAKAASKDKEVRIDLSYCNARGVASQALCPNASKYTITDVCGVHSIVTFLCIPK